MAGFTRPFVMTRLCLQDCCLEILSPQLPGHRALGNKATIYKVLVWPGRESKSRPTSTEADALTTKRRAGARHSLTPTDCKNAKQESETNLTFNSSEYFYTLRVEMRHFDPFFFISMYIMYNIHCCFHCQNCLFPTPKRKKDWLKHTSRWTKTHFCSVEKSTHFTKKWNKNINKFFLLLFAFTLSLYTTLTLLVRGTCYSLQIGFAHFDSNTIRFFYLKF